MNKKILAALAVSLAAVSHAIAAPVRVELALLVDVSGSVDSDEFALQKTGYINAFKSNSIQSAIANLSGGIAVTYIEWSGAGDQAQLVPWTHITDAASASAFAALIGATSRSSDGFTAPGSAINFAAPLFSDNGFEGDRLVIDVSGDGRENDGADTRAARDAALAAGIDAINGLAILTDDPALDAWYADNIKGGAGAFVLSATGFEDFESAVREKIGREIAIAPTWSLLGLMALGLPALRSRQSRKR